MSNVENYNGDMAVSPTGQSTVKWTRAQQKTIDTRGCNLLVSAAAGSGKTAVLVERIIQMVFDKEHPVNLDELLVVTFTKAAAAQMKEKIASAIEEKIECEPGNEYYIKQLNMVGQANILTIDSFCYKLVKEYFHVLSIDPKVQVAEEAELAVLQQEILEAVMEEAYRDNRDFEMFSDAYSGDKKDDIIEEYILKLYGLSQSYSDPDGWLVNAKRDLHVESKEDFDRLAFAVAYYEDVRLSASEIKRTILTYLDAARRKDGPIHYEAALLADLSLVEDIVSAKTYEGFANVRTELSDSSFARLGRPKKGAGYDPELAEMIKNGRDRYKKMIKKLLDSFSIPLDTVIGQFSKQEGMLSAYVDVTMEFSHRFLEAKIESGFVGFSDIEHYALQVLCDGFDDRGEPIPTAIGKELSERFCEILIDEYQDSNYLQEDILKCVSGLSYGKNNMFMVGDVKQSIYGFRMARPDLFMYKYDTYEDITDALTDEAHENGRIILKNNFRSRENVLNGINYIFYQIMQKALGGIDYTDNEALVPGRQYPAYRRDEVELLIGESTELDTLEEDEEKQETEEHLDDEYIDVSAMELEAAMVAGRIESLMGGEGEEPFLVTDQDGKALRPIEYRDIVILFRSPKKYQPVFSEILAGRGIPVRLQNENGYFDTVEIRGILTLFHVLDNPHDDVEYAALLRGYFGGLTEEELSVLALLKREKKYSYFSELTDCMLKMDVSVFSALYEKEKFDDGRVFEIRDFEEKYGVNLNLILHKCVELSKQICYYRERKGWLSIHELAREIYDRSGYYYYIKAMPQGRERCRNLNLFLDEIKRFERGRSRTLFDFLRFVNRLLERGVSLGGDPAIESSENVVRIMSIHKSKGLEFPVVFVSGMGKKYNLSDTKAPIVLHSDYYIGARFVDTDKRCGNDTFTRKAFVSLMTAELIAEELRILYVALTRAKEKLIMTGVAKDISALIGKYAEIARQDNRQLDYGVIRNSMSYLELIVAAFIRNRSFHEAVKKVRPRMDHKGNRVTADYDFKYEITDITPRFLIQMYDYSSLVVSQIETGEEQGRLRLERLKEFADAPFERQSALLRKLAWRYADEFYTRQSSKLSVTEIKRMFEDMEGESDDGGYEQLYDAYSAPAEALEKRQGENAGDASANITQGKKDFQMQMVYRKKVPEFISGEQPMTAAEKGTWMHKAMELLDNANIDNSDQVLAELERLFQEGRLPEEARSFITAEKITAFVCSDVGKRMRKAARENRLYKEKKFVVGVPARSLVGMSEEGISVPGDMTDHADMSSASSTASEVPDVVVQGIIDAYFEEDGQLVLIDYKTDHIKSGQEGMLVERYRTQLAYYKHTLEQLTGMPVKEMYLYSFALDKEIRM